MNENEIPNDLPRPLPSQGLAAPVSLPDARPSDVAPVAPAGKPARRALPETLTAAEDARAFVAHLTRYATGAEVSYADRADVRRIVEETRGEGYRLRALIHGLARSRLFLPPQR